MLVYLRPVNGTNNRWGQLERQKAAWIKERNAAVRARREQVSDWIANGIEELEGESKDIERYGLDGYFKKSIAVLKEQKAGGNDASKGTMENAAQLDLENAVQRSFASSREIAFQPI